MRSFILTRHMPSPSHSGSCMRNWSTFSTLRSLGETTVCCLRIGSSTPALPCPTGAYRCFSWTITVSPLRILLALVRLPWGIADAFLRLTYDARIAAALGAAIREAAPDIVIVTEPWLLGYIPSLRMHDATLVVDLHNIEQPLYTHVLATAEGWRTKAKAWLLLRIAKVLEPKFLQEADSVWVCSDHDATVLRGTYGQLSNVHVVPSGIDIDYYAPDASAATAALDNTPSVLYCANFGYGPNAEAAQRLIHGILPRAATAQPCRLVLAGSNPTASMHGAAARNSAILVTGAVDDMRPYLRCQGAVYAIPLMQGSGTRLKILEAFAAGIPVVSTRKGAEGLHVHDGQELLFADTDAEFAQALALLWSDVELRDRLRLRARTFLEQHASLAAVRESIVSACRFATASVRA